MRFVRPREVLEMIGVSRSTLWRMVQAGEFPPPVRITQRNSGYVLEAVEEWMRARADGLPWTYAPSVQARTDSRAPASGPVGLHTSRRGHG
jgi:prophage regulatory protein